jgi:hypothetical protein
VNPARREDVGEPTRPDLQTKWVAGVMFLLSFAAISFIGGISVINYRETASQGKSLVRLETKFEGMEAALGRMVEDYREMKGELRLLLEELRKR